MVVYSKQNACASILGLALEALPVLKALKLHDETVAAVRLLSQAVGKKSLSHQLLRELRELLRQDPLAKL